ncbi:hypothetical protein ACROSR_11060 [Roseovarius tibetensis]|uniref:hypothetical protein n=1 Tax=Roseovarius tibetensis TaxID=2685897 RepID=UPI003D7FDB85
MAIPESPVIAPVRLADGLWGLTGAHVPWRMGVPVPLRSVVAVLPSGEVWVHAPGPLTYDLRTWLAGLGPVAHIVRPYAPTLAWLDDWRAAFPAARLWHGPEMRTASWARHIKPLILEGSQTEAVFLHHASRSVILSRLMMAVETEHLPVWARPLIWLAGLDDSDGKPPMALAPRLGGRRAVGDVIEQVLDWGPERLILTHGRCYGIDAGGEMTRAFRRLMRARLWDRALEESKRG